MLIFQINMLTVLDTVINGILTSKMATCVMAPHISFVGLPNCLMYFD